jgi:hypothetical protein
VPCGLLGANLRQWQAEQLALAAIGPAAITPTRVETVGQPQLLIFC